MVAAMVDSAIGGGLIKKIPLDNHNALHHIVAYNALRYNGQGPDRLIKKTAHHLTDRKTRRLIMAQAKTRKGSQKKRTAKNRFYVVNTVQRTGRRLSDKLEDVSDTYISGPIRNGRARVTDLRQAPRKTLFGWLDEGKEMITDLNQETRSTMDKMVKDGKAFLTNVGKSPRKTLDGVLDDGRAWVDDLREDACSRMAELKTDTRSMLAGIGKDAQLVVDEVVSGGRKALDKVPGKRTVEKAVRIRIRKLPAQLNMPSKKDIDGLSRRVSALNKKVDALHRTVAA
jgi:hypothetical protein